MVKNIFVLSIIGSLIGWITNVIAIKMLFIPRKPIKILFWNFQGVLPKRKLEIAKNISKVINEELLPVDELSEIANMKEVHSKVATIIASNITSKIVNFFPQFIAEKIDSKILEYFYRNIYKEVEIFFNEVSIDIMPKIKDKEIFSDLIEYKIMSFELKHLEKLIYQVANNELKYIEVFGAVLGFIIGIIQAVIISFI